MPGQRGGGTGLPGDRDAQLARPSVSLPAAWPIESGQVLEERPPALHTWRQRMPAGRGWTWWQGLSALPARPAGGGVMEKTREG